MMSTDAVIPITGILILVFGHLRQLADL